VDGEDRPCGAPDRNPRYRAGAVRCARERLGETATTEVGSGMNVSDGIGGAAGRSSARSTEIVHESERTRVTRLFLSGRAVIRKEPLGPDAKRRLGHEVTMLERLRGVVGVAQLVEAPRSPGTIVMEDVGSRSLAGVAKPLAVNELIGLAVSLARVVAGLHSRGVMHGDITPGNIVISPDGAPCLVDFSLATSLADIRPEFMHHREIVGTLAYLAPEQTGLTGRSVDQRADLYAMGATLYELATGEPPFGSGDPLRITHDHLARVALPPVEVNPAVPVPLSEIVMHLLEKEPDNRYQTAEGAAYDLERLRDAHERPEEAPVRVGERDFPLRLLAPSRLVGRDDEVRALEAAFVSALTGGSRGVLVSGAAGVGKTALVDELRPVVSDKNGWFVAGKFDQYRRDLEFDAVNQALRSLGRRLLAEPDDQLTDVRQRILDAVGSNAGLLTAAVPEFSALLAVEPEPGDPLTAQVRAQRTAGQLLRAVASRRRPVVLFLDDLQWAAPTPLGVVDLVLSEDQIDGLLLVGAYREGDDAPDSLAALLSRWPEQAGVTQVRLANLPTPSLVTMVAEMLRVDPATAADLVQVIEPHSSGNPYETVELVNALRRDGALTATPEGWRWDEAAVRARLGGSVVATLVAARVEAMPSTSRYLLEAMAALGGKAEVSMLQAATGDAASVVEEMLAPALDEGVLVLEPGAHEVVRFRHDRTREVILRGLVPGRRRALQLAMARRLAEAPELFAAAAEQYLPVIDAVDEAAERSLVIALLRRAAEQAALTGDYALVNALLVAALQLVDPADTPTLIEVHTRRHAALYSLGRLEEADDEYRTIERLSTTALERADATSVQVHSLTHRKRFTDAVGLCLESLRELGLAVPATGRLPAEIDHHFQALYRWLDQTEDAGGLGRPEISDPSLLAAARLLNAALAAAHAADGSVHAWVSLEALRIWLEHGPARSLVGPASAAAFALIALRGDHVAGYRAVRRILASGEAAGYVPDTSLARFVFALLACWFEPIERALQEAQRAREGLSAMGDLAYAGSTYYPSVPYLLDCAPTLDVYVAEVEAGLAFTRRTGNELTGQALDSHRWLISVLRGGRETAAPGETVPLDRYSDNPLALFAAHLSRATAAAIFGDSAGLAAHTKAAMPLLPAVMGSYLAVPARLLRGLALAEEARSGRGDEHEGWMLELEEVTGWLAARAADAPDNFLHLLRLLEAERAWALGDFRAAVIAFDAAVSEVAHRQRPWHRALIAERAARFYLAHGVEQAGYELLAHARAEYLAWGAAAKVAQLDWAYPTVRPHTETSSGQHRVDQPGDPAHRRPVTTGTIDLLGILSASQVLSSETDIDRLHTRVVEVLSGMTGATGVHLLLWNDDRECWLLPGAGTDGADLPISGRGHECLVPMSVLRYAQRVREPLVVEDVSRDDRFASDPYFADITGCSLLALPILSRGTLRALLLLENRLIRAAFTTERLDAIRLIAGQLAVSLDNAQVNAEFRRMADEQAALRRLATLVARGVPAGELFEAVATEAKRVLDLDTSSLIRFESDGSATLLAVDSALPPVVDIGDRVLLDAGTAAAQVQSTGRPARVEVYEDSSGPMSDTLRRLGYRGSVGAPVAVDGRVWGVMLASWAGERVIPPDSEERLVQFTELVATAVANADSRVELITSRARIVATADQTRQRLERNLHDGAQQRLVSVAVQLRAAQEVAPPDLARELDNVTAGLNTALDDLRELARGIHPPILVEGGLGPALRALARRSAVPVELDLRTAGRLPEPVEIAAYFVVSEALTNTIKHARASAFTVAIEADAADAVLRVAVQDDGAGGADFSRGTGLVGLKDRVEALGGRIFLHSPRSAGTSLRVELPLTAVDGGVVPG